MAIDVIFGQLLQKEMLNFPDEDLQKIKCFVEHVRKKGFYNLEGRNKPSDDVQKDDPCWLEKVRYVQKYDLWHYHIGIPKYDNSDYGDKVSEYVLHYIKGDGFIKIVEFNQHPPFKLPSEDYLI